MGKNLYISNFSANVEGILMHTNKCQNKSLLGLAKLFKMAFDGVDLTPMGASLIKRAEQDPNDAEALMDLSIVLQLKYQQELALGVQAQALRIKTLYHLPAIGDPSIRLLAIMAPGDLMTNTPLEFLVEDSNISLDMLYISPELPFPTTLPEHDLAFIAIGESNKTQSILEELADIIEEWPHPVLNRPSNILKTSREAAPSYFAKLNDVVMPSSLRVNGNSLTTESLPELPFIIRPVGSHAGHGLARIDKLEQIADYLDTHPDAEFLISPFIDYRNTDGMFRKYRVVLIGGKPYACHMGISENWMIHYLNAGMTEDGSKRREEARFMTEFETGFGIRHKSAFAGIHSALALDYLVIDCAETQDGKLLVFEIDTGAVIHAMDPPDIFPYKIPQMKKVFQAFHTMLVDSTYECEGV